MIGIFIVLRTVISTVMQFKKKFNFFYVVIVLDLVWRLYSYNYAFVVVVQSWGSSQVTIN